MLFGLRTNDGQQAAKMSGMAQSFGHLLATIGSTLFGALHNIYRGWVFPMTMLTVLVGIIFVVYIAADKK